VVGFGATACGFGTVDALDTTTACGFGTVDALAATTVCTDVADVDALTAVNVHSDCVALIGFANALVAVAMGNGRSWNGDHAVYDSGRCGPSYVTCQPPPQSSLHVRFGGRYTTTCTHIYTFAHIAYQCRSALVYFGTHNHT
jgi:hypothetical protein